MSKKNKDINFNQPPETRQNVQKNEMFFNKKKSFSHFRNAADKNFANYKGKQVKIETFRKYPNLVKTNIEQQTKKDRSNENIEKAEISELEKNKNRINDEGPSNLDSKIDKMDKKIDAIGEKIDAFGKKIDNGFIAIGTKIDNGFIAIGKKIDNGFIAIGTKIDNGFSGFKSFFADLFSKYFPKKIQEKEAKSNNQNDNQNDRYPSSEENKKSDSDQISYAHSEQPRRRKYRVNKEMFLGGPKAERLKKKDNGKKKYFDNSNGDERKISDNSGKHYGKNETIPSLRRKYQNEIKKKNGK